MSNADIVILKKEDNAFAPSNSLSAMTWSSFEGRRFNVKVEATYRRGAMVRDRIEIKNEAGGDHRFLRPTLVSNAV